VLQQQVLLLRRRWLLLLSVDTNATHVPVAEHDDDVQGGVAEGVLCVDVRSVLKAAVQHGHALGASAETRDILAVVYVVGAVLSLVVVGVAVVV
jgi:hypothetical protein